MTAEEVLQQFYNEYAEWLETGAEPGKFWRTMGLCTNLLRTAPCHVNYAMDLMEDQFRTAGLDIRCPFNMEGRTYAEESFAHEMHLNETRIKWVMEHKQ